MVGEDDQPSPRRFPLQALDERGRTRELHIPAERPLTLYLDRRELVLGDDPGAPGAGQDVTAEEVIDHCRGRLAGYKRPRSCSFLREDEIPRNATGKVLKRELAGWDSTDGRANCSA